MAGLYRNGVRFRQPAMPMAGLDSKPDNTAAHAFTEGFPR
jgi:hypothetical protein